MTRHCTPLGECHIDPFLRRRTCLAYWNPYFSIYSRRRTNKFSSSAICAACAPKPLLFIIKYGHENGDTGSGSNPSFTVVTYGSLQFLFFSRSFSFLFFPFFSIFSLLVPVTNFKWLRTATSRIFRRVFFFCKNRWERGVKSTLFEPPSPDEITDYIFYGGYFR